jgi:hypothetical protein
MQRKEFVQELTWWPCARHLKHLSLAHLFNARLRSDCVGREDETINIMLKLDYCHIQAYCTRQNFWQPNISSGYKIDFDLINCL